MRGMHQSDDLTQAAQLAAARAEWDAAAPDFDAEPDHGLGDPQVRTAWADLLRTHLPQPSASVLDLGCGTGSLSLLLAELGHPVTGIDLSPAMIARAENKAESQPPRPSFLVMNAADPSFGPESFDVLLCRHLLWALPALAEVLERWAVLLRPQGRLILIEGRWHTGAGLRAAEIAALLPPALVGAGSHDLSANPTYWGRPVADERYVLVAAKM